MVQLRRFGAYNDNVYKFRTTAKEEEMKTQNSGVYVTSDTKSYASKRDSLVEIGDDEPYILALEARFVYYVEDVVEKEWSVVVHVKPRDLFGMREDYGQIAVVFSPNSWLEMSSGGDIGDLQLTRNDELEDPSNNARDTVQYDDTTKK
ncbi:hypothetical protein PIB30_000330 [Stylosanthes scabra]|uniref:DUF4216 domain-containing protein n=1 Tax=Stylosanthes scabra TaxID=79078 RepID=A0ABU6T278_9FABA|nr:hypothetical protein [Stylosanthes scabra]